MAILGDTKALSLEVINGIKGNLTGNVNGNSATADGATRLGYDSTMYIYGQNGNEVNFGGSNNSSIIHFGYRAKDSKPVPSEYIFSNGNATIRAGKVYGAVFN